MSDFTEENVVSLFKGTFSYKNKMSGFKSVTKAYPQRRKPNVLAEPPAKIQKLDIEESQVLPEKPDPVTPCVVDDQSLSTDDETCSEDYEELARETIREEAKEWINLYADAIVKMEVKRFLASSQKKSKDKASKK